jgi:hypothetical protein
MASVDWSARPDQIENLALREVGVCPIACSYANQSFNFECFTGIRPRPRAVLQWSQNRSSPHQRRASVLL